MRNLRKTTGRAYWLTSFFGLHFFPTVLVYLGCVPLFFALQSPRPLGPLDGLAATVTLGAIAIETVADEQLRRFRRHCKDHMKRVSALVPWSPHDHSR